MPEVEYVWIQCAETQDWTGQDQVRLVVADAWVADTYVGAGQNVEITVDHMGSPIFIDAGQLVQMKEVDVVGDDMLAQVWIEAADIAAGSKDFDDSTGSAKYLFRIKWKPPVT